MEIKLDSTVLCHGHARVLGQAQGPIGELDIAGNLETQVRRPVRATHARPVGRGGESVMIGFAVEIEFATLALAEAFIGTFLGAPPRSGSLVITYDGGGTRTFAAAALTNYRLTQIGVCVKVQYNYTAGASS